MFVSNNSVLGFLSLKSVLSCFPYESFFLFSACGVQCSGRGHRANLAVNVKSWDGPVRQFGSCLSCSPARSSGMSSDLVLYLDFKIFFSESSDKICWIVEDEGKYLPVSEELRKTVKKLRSLVESELGKKRCISI